MNSLNNILSEEIECHDPEERIPSFINEIDGSINPNQGLKGFLSSLDFPVPKFVRDSLGKCPNWILPLDQLSFGVEVECYDREGVQNDVGVYHSDQRGHENVYCDFLPSFNGLKWKVEEDGSLDLDGGKEFISPILKGSEGIENVVNSLKILIFFLIKRCFNHFQGGPTGRPNRPTIR